MNELDFYLFDVDHGQSAALRLPNGRWCLFDLGASERFHPLRDWILPRLVGHPVLKTTISHLHGDHLGDLPCLYRTENQYLRLPEIDEQYVCDAMETCSGRESRELVAACRQFASGFEGAIIPDYGGVLIREKSLGAARARRLGGAANTRVNNASVVTRIDYAGRSILICGDMERSAWDALLAGPRPDPLWRSLVSSVDVLVAPHHGHRSGYSAALMAWARPKVVLVSVASKDPSVDSRYSSPDIPGITLGGKPRERLTTREDGHIRVTIRPPVWGAGSGGLSVTTRKGSPPPTSAEFQSEPRELGRFLQLVRSPGGRPR